MLRTGGSLPAFALAAALAAGWTEPAAAQQGAGERIGETVDRAARDIRRGVRETAEAVRESFARTRASVQAMGVQARVYSRLHWDKALNAAAIELEVSRDGVATLRGSVPDTPAKARAAELARQTVGVTRVVDELAVSPSPGAGTTTTTTTTTP